MTHHDAAGTPLLQATDLVMRFGGVTAIDHVDFTLAPGELRCLIGPNGAGKSTFFKMVSGQLRPTAGAIAFDGVNLVGRERHDIAQLGIGIKTQVPNVFEGLTVRDNLRVAARRNRLGEPTHVRVDEVLQRLRLEALAERRVELLAHGQRQWVELGLVVAAAPRLVLLDEPVAGMSDEETERTAELILDIARDAAVVVVEHDIPFIRRIGSNVTVFHQGRILTEGPVEAVLNNRDVQDVYLGRQVKTHA